MAAEVKTTVGVFATRAVESYLKRLKKYEKLVIDDRDPEDLHQMRVNLRKLRTVMQVFSPGICLPKLGREPQVATISRKLGRLRDLDVFLVTLQAQYLPDLPAKEINTLKAIFMRLAKKRKKLVKKTKSTLKSDRYQELKKSLRQWTANPRHSDIASLDIDVTLPDLMLPSISRLWLHPGWLINKQRVDDALKPANHLSAIEVDALINNHGKMLHSLRKQIKRVRYQLRLVSKFYGNRLREDLKKLGQLQETLGALQDGLVIDDVLGQVLPNWQTRLPTLKALLAHNRHQAWRLWQKLQHHYLDSTNRHTLRQILLQPKNDCW